MPSQVPDYKYDRGFGFAKGRRFRGVAPEQQKACHIRGRVFDVASQNLHAVDLGGPFGSDCRGVHQSSLLDTGNGTARVRLEPQRNAIQSAEIRAALLEGVGVRIDATYGCQFGPRMSHQAVRDGKKDLAHDVKLVIQDQVVVLVNAAGEGVLYGHDPPIDFPFLNAPKNLGRAFTGRGLGD
jgi:hypothetical protein